MCPPAGRAITEAGPQPHWIPAFAGKTVMQRSPEGKIEMGALAMPKSKAVYVTPGLNSYRSRGRVESAGALVYKWPGCKFSTGDDQWVTGRTG